LLRFRGDTLYEGEHFATAIADYQPILEQYGEQPEAWRVWYNYSGCLSALGKARAATEADQQALRCLRKLFESGRVTSEKQLASLWLHEGMLYGRQKQWQLAEHSFLLSIRTDWGAGGIWWLYTAYRWQHRRFMVAVTFPLAVAYAIGNVGRENHERTSSIEQRASVPPTLLSQLEALATPCHGVAHGHHCSIATTRTLATSTFHKHAQPDERARITLIVA
jgi:tetratricopeptide (TPR) repeat protein